jgi:predicted oxidoreductase
MPMMAPSVQETQVARLVPTALAARLGMVRVDHADILVRVERDAAFGAGMALASPRPRSSTPAIGSAGNNGP